MAEPLNLTNRDDVRELVREKYGAAALTVLNGQGAACCGGNVGGGDACCGGDVITGNLYSNVEASEIPQAALLASLGCGNPTALAALNPGEVVLDLGSGGGIDVLLSAKRVGPTGFVFGLDMTDEMLALAEQNKANSGAQNVTFLKGHIEAIPLPDASVDVVISNCVINLSADKDAVLREAFRVLRPGGRFAVSDVVVDGPMPAAVRADMEAFVGCVAGALEKDDYLMRLAQAGFVDASIEPTRRYTFADLEATTCCSPEVAALSPDEKAGLDGRVMGAFIRAVKPKAPSPPIMKDAMMRRYAAEFVGTFGIVFAPVSLSASGHFAGGESGLMAAAWVSGLAVLAMIYALGPISAAHFNPAVTLGFAVAGRFPWRYVLPYWVSELLGGIAAAALAALLFGGGHGVQSPAGGNLLRAVGVEAVLTFFLMLVIIAVATDKRVDGAVPGVAIGLTVVFDVLIGGPVTGGSMNPARAFGPAIFAGPAALGVMWVYVVGPAIGAATAACVYEAMRGSDRHAQGAPNDLYEALHEIEEKAHATR